MTKQSTDQIKVEKWLAIRKEAGRKIDPETAEVIWSYEYTVDPYGTDPELPEELQQVGREYFARSPGSDIWVWFGDLPAATRDALWEKHKAKLAFPAGLPLTRLARAHKAMARQIPTGTRQDTIGLNRCEGCGRGTANGL
jgi:hypothetical protein